MPSTFTANLNLEEPARGEQIGTWDTPVNSNTTILDAAYGATATIPLTNANVTLNTAQYQSQYIVFTGTITANIAITFPYIGSQHTIENRTNGAFTITLQTTNASAEVICCPPYEAFDILTRASTAGARYRNLGRVASYWDYAGSSVPAWVSGCTIPPYLNCDGTAFSSATYPALATIFGGTTLPDARGRTRYALDTTSGRVTAAVTGVDGNSFLAAGGSQLLHQHTHGVFDPGHSHTTGLAQGDNDGTTGAQGGDNINFGQASIGGNSVTSISINNAGTGGSQNLPPMYVGGLTLVRAM